MLLNKCGAQGSAENKREKFMKVVKWFIALAVVLVFVGCQKSDEQKLDDAKEDAAKAVEGVKVPSQK